MSVLLTGATGRIGPHVVAELLRRDVPTTVLARDGARARGILGDDVHVVEGTYEQIDEHLTGVDSALLLTPHGPGMADDQRRILSHLDGRVARIVKVSGTATAIRPDGPETGRQHWEIEQLLRERHPGAVIVRPNAFMQTLVPGIVAAAHSGTIPDPLDGAGLSLVDCADIGGVLAVALTDPSYDGRMLTLTGRLAYTYQDIADAIAAAGGPRAEVVTVPIEEAVAGVRATAGEWAANHLAQMLQLFRDGMAKFGSRDVSDALGRLPRTIEDYLQTQAAALSPAIPTASAAGTD